MLKHCPKPLVAAAALVMYTANTVFWATPIFLFTGVKALLPIGPWRRGCSRLLTWFAGNWIWVNNRIHQIVGRIEWDIKGLENLDRSGWYLVLANHRSWVDIFVLQKTFYRRIPFLKFFIKKELFWFPILGQAWWALDFPFVKRYTRQTLEKHPHLRGKDLEITRKACEKFKTIPVSIMNFVEGTRFTEEKHDRQRSPYTHLLKPKAGGAAFVLQVLGEQIDRILDVTIVYPAGSGSFRDLLSGRLRKVAVRVSSLPVTEDLIGDYTNDAQFRESLQMWLNRLWSEKDRRIQELMTSGGQSA